MFLNITGKPKGIKEIFKNEKSRITQFFRDRFGISETSSFLERVRKTRDRNFEREDVNADED